MGQVTLLTFSSKVCGSAAAISLTSDHPIDVIIHFQANIFLHWYDCIFCDYDFAQDRSINLFLVLISPQTVELNKLCS